MSIPEIKRDPETARERVAAAALVCGRAYDEFVASVRRDAACSSNQVLIASMNLLERESYELYRALVSEHPELAQLTPFELAAQFGFQFPVTEAAKQEGSAVSVPSDVDGSVGLGIPFRVTEVPLRPARVGGDLGTLATAFGKTVAPPVMSQEGVQSVVDLAHAYGDPVTRHAARQMPVASANGTNGTHAVDPIVQQILPVIDKLKETMRASRPIRFDELNGHIGKACRALEEFRTAVNEGHLDIEHAVDTILVLVGVSFDVVRGERLDSALRLFDHDAFRHIDTDDLRRLLDDERTADLVDLFLPSTPVEQRALVVSRIDEVMRDEWRLVRLVGRHYKWCVQFLRDDIAFGIQPADAARRIVDIVRQARRDGGEAFLAFRSLPMAEWTLELVNQLLVTLFPDVDSRLRDAIAVHMLPRNESAPAMSPDDGDGQGG